MKTEQIEAEEFAPEQMPQGTGNWRWSSTKGGML